MFFGLALSFRKRVNKFAYTDTILMYTFAKRNPFSSIAFICTVLIPGRGWILDSDSDSLKDRSGSDLERPI